MTFQPKKPCLHPGCRNLTTESYCQQHKTGRSKAKTHAVKLRNSNRWRIVRAQYRADHPLCCDPLGVHGGMPEPMDHVHHVQPLETNPDLAFYEANLRSLCSGCHAKIEAMERGGEPTQHLFHATSAKTD